MKIISYHKSKISKKDSVTIWYVSVCLLYSLIFFGAHLLTTLYGESKSESCIYILNDMKYHNLKYWSLFVAYSFLLLKMEGYSHSLFCDCNMQDLDLTWKNTFSSKTLELPSYLSKWVRICYCFSYVVGNCKTKNKLF